MKMQLKTINDFSLKNETVLVRVDFNVPIKDGKIQDTTRIDETIKTISTLIDKSCKIVLMSHLGNPKGTVNQAYTLKPIADYLQSIVKTKVHFAPDCIGEKTKNLIENSQPKEMILLENLRFHQEEETPSSDLSFAKELASLASYYINDAFGTAHRQHSSTYYICEFFKQKVMIGLLMEKEIDALKNLLDHPKKPFLALLGGAKIESKIKVIESLLKKVDTLLIGGAMAIPFLIAQGHPLYHPLVTSESIELAKNILKAQKVELHLPLDFVVAEENNPSYPSKISSIHDPIQKPTYPADIGPLTIESFKKKLKGTRTIFWNGPMGLFELHPYEKGTLEIAKIIGTTKAYSVVGGGDSVAAIQKLGLQKNFSHLSTGGGASLEYIELGTLCGLQAIEKASQA
jgi:phosphoglycerate kinase